MPVLKRLPVDAVLAELCAVLGRERRAVLSAPPGSGKTTRVPPALIDHLADLQGKVVVLEPRRLAARAAAARVAFERGSELGGEVGYRVRDERRVSGATRIEFVTEGVLVRQLVQDPFLEGVGAVVLDEFHERHVETDLALSMLVEVADTVRDDLVLVAMSATLDAAPLVGFLGGAPVVEAHGTLFPVEIDYADQGGDGQRPLEDRVRDAVVRSLDHGPGDLLVFLPGVGEIERCRERVGDAARRRGAEVLTLHGGLPAREQDRVLEPDPAHRRVVLSTNVAESSLTIEGVTTVIDSGLARMVRHDPARGLDVLEVERISRASADQRAGRAGRLGPGRCVRLWSRAEDRGLRDHDVAEILRADLAAPLLTVAAFAGRDTASFGWFERPDAAALASARELLRRLGALEPDDRVTACGREMLRHPMHPRLARAWVEARRDGRALHDIATACALLGERELLAGDEARHAPVDLEDRLDRLARAERDGLGGGACRAQSILPNVARAVVRGRERLLRGARVGGGAEDLATRRAALARALLAGFPDRVARRAGDGVDQALMVGGRGLEWRRGALHDDSALVLALDVGDFGDRRRRTRSQLRLGLGLDEELLVDVLPDAFGESTDLELDDAGTLHVIRRRTFFDLPLEERRGGPRREDEERVQQLLAEVLARDPFRWLGDGQQAIKELQARLRFLARSDPEAGVPVPGDAEIAAAAASLCAGKRSLRFLKDAPVAEVLRQTLPGDVAARLRRDVPDKVALPTGRQARIDYLAGDEPVLAVRLQELFGQLRTPAILGGRHPLLLHLLGPNHRPVQVTRDLESFWNNVYHDVRGELRRRYPKHSWPEDPRQAEPESRPKRRRG